MALRGNHKNVPLPQRMEARKFLTNVARNSRQPSRQGFPILLDETRAREQKSERLLRVSIKVAHLARDIADASPIHQTQDRTIELSQQARDRASARLTRIFASGAITALVQLILNGIITNDKFCLSRMKHLSKRSARKSFPHERQYPSEATEDRGCPKVENNENTTVEHSTLYDRDS